ncbi:immunoglobulin superfamily member 6 [Orycteropus afer afer]|uniref:immunoglobulin superfamily member 6 n=1 Tax=Orycteropus afer afer TaxID=1230840 RepID=UPI001C5CB805|nr:immunoglobulin superfamily member 6 [Orycteropus afer afer]
MTIALSGALKTSHSTCLYWFENKDRVIQNIVVIVHVALTQNNLINAELQDREQSTGANESGQRSENGAWSLDLRGQVPGRVSKARTHTKQTLSSPRSHAHTRRDGDGHRGKTALRLAMNLILFYVGAVGACTVTVTQPPYLEVDYTHEATAIECTFSPSGCPTKPPASLWFRYSAHQSETLCWDGCRSEADKFIMHESLAQNRVSLTVNRVTLNDSAIYICGIAFPSSKNATAKQTGGGTVLVVRELKLLSPELRNALIVLLSLLSVYVTVVGVTITVLTRSKLNTLRNKDPKEESQKKSARRIFQDIAQELYHKRYAETSQPPEKDHNTYENRRAHDNYERP